MFLNTHSLVGVPDATTQEVISFPSCATRAAFLEAFFVVAHAHVSHVGATE